MAYSLTRDEQVVVYSRTQSETTPFLHPQEQSFSALPDDQRYRRLIPLTELAHSYRKETCPPDLVFVNDTILDPKLAWEGGRKIPRIIHMTSRSRCVHPEFATAIDKWRFPDHSLFLHDDEAIAVLLERKWEEFPLLQSIQRCLLHGGAFKADLWRLLAMWEYGGIYTDIDNIPNRLNGTTIQPDDQGFFQIEKAQVPSQWFFAIAPRHPMMYFAVNLAIQNVMYMLDIGVPRIVWTTGPGAMNRAFLTFTHGKDKKPGRYHGVGNYTVRLVGDQSNQHYYVKRAIFRFKQKAAIMSTMNMTHITRMNLKNPMNRSCLAHMYLLDTGRNATFPTS